MTEIHDEVVLKFCGANADMGSVHANKMHSRRANPLCILQGCSILLLDVAYTYGTGVTTVGCYVKLRTSDRRQKRGKLVQQVVDKVKIYSN
jgi:hypothetical protein